MAQMLQHYPTIFIEYDEHANPFFPVLVVEALDTIKKFPTGAKLLKKIADSTPSKTGNLPAGARVLIKPTPERVFLPHGTKRVFGQLVPNPGDTSARPFNPTPLSGNCNAAADQTGASGGGGSVATVYFNNTTMLTSRGEQSYPFIILAHELIHAYHGLYGLKKDGPDEELYTAGIDKFAGEEITENKIREEARLPTRAEYFE